MSYIQTPLPYDVNALEPAMDAETLSIHYGKHHATYTKNLNAALEKHPEFTPPRCPGKLLMEIEKVPPAIFNAVRNFGGGHFNHAFSGNASPRPARITKPSANWPKRSTRNSVPSKRFAMPSRLRQPAFSAPDGPGSS